MTPICLLVAATQSRKAGGVLVKFSGLLGCCLLVTACSRPDLPAGPEAYKVIPAAAALGSSQVDYKIGPLDELSITVFREPDLSLDEVPVDASGNIIFPLIGQLFVAGKTSTEISDMIRTRLGERFLVDPQVSVIVKSSVSQKVTVEGQVTEPGVFELQGQTTLLQALAMAKGPTRVAKLDQVIIFREMDGQRYAAMFNVDDIRKGRAADPQILGNDTVVIGLSGAKALYRDFMTVAPLLTTVFVALEQNN